MKVLFHLGHPAHFHLFKHCINHFNKNGGKSIVAIKKKDILEDLLKNAGIDYINILPEGRNDSKLAIAWSVLKKDWKLFQICKKMRPDILIGTSIEIGHVGYLLGIPAINVHEDDAHVVPLHAKFGYGLSDFVISPKVCNNGKWEKKSIKYEGYHELCYLHPAYFNPEKSIVNKYTNAEKPYFILRLANLNAHHDTGRTGIDDAMVQKIILQLENFGEVFISSERKLPPMFEKHRILIDPLDIHHILYYAEMYLGDSQTMAAEAAVLGTPSIRYNDFVGEIGYLEELEHKYGLTFGVRTSSTDKLFDTIDQILSLENRKTVFRNKKNEMLSEKIDVNSFFIWFIENYPKSANIMRENPDYQERFK